MKALLVPALWLLLLGFPSSWLVLRSVGVALAVAPLLAGLTCALAAMIAVATHTSLVLWVVVLALALLAGVLVWSPRMHIRLPAWEVGVVALITTPLLLMARVSPWAWDSHSIWWFHAEWFRVGGARATDAMANPLLAFSHPDYPPLTSATVATIWRVTGDRPDARVALLVTIVLTWSALVSFGVALLWTLRHATAGRLPVRLLAAGLAGFAALAATGSASLYAGAGYVDHQWAAWFAGAAVLLLLAPPDRDTTILGAVLLAGAMLTKNEAQVAGIGLVVLATIRHRRRGRVEITIPWIPVVLSFAWTALARLLGATSDLLEGGRFGQLLRGNTEVIDRLHPTLVATRDIVLGVALATVAVNVLGALWCRGVRRRARVGSDLWMWGLLAGYLAALTVTYLISPYDIAWHLNSSIGRTMVAPLMILISIMTVWSVLALLPHGAVFATTPGPEPIDEDDGDDHPREASPHAETGAHPAASVEEIATEVGTRSNT